MVGKDRGGAGYVVTRAADLQEKRQGLGLDWTGQGRQDGYGVVCAPQPFETATETEPLLARTTSGKPADASIHPSIYQSRAMP